MEHQSPQTPAESALPRPVVLRPEDLASVAAAGFALSPALFGRLIIAGGLPAVPYLATAAMY